MIYNEFRPEIYHVHMTLKMCRCLKIKSLNKIIFILDDSIGKKMDLITTSLNQLTAHHGNSESSNNHKGGGLNLHLPSGGGGGHGGFNPNNGLNPFSNPYMHNR